MEGVPEMMTIVYSGHVLMLLWTSLVHFLSSSFINKSMALINPVQANNALPKQRVNQSVLRAHFQIYLSCLMSASVLYLGIAFLDFWHGRFSPSGNSFPDSGALFAYMSLTIGWVVPLFYGLQVGLEHKRVGTSVEQCLMASQPLKQSLLFCVLLMLVIPLLEVAKLELGVLTFQPTGVFYFLIMSGAYAYCPLIAFCLLNSACGVNINVLVSPAHWKSRIQVFSLSNKANHRLLSSEDLTLSMLASKTDDELELLIETARVTGYIDKAELISNYLLSRHTSLNGSKS